MSFFNKRRVSAEEFGELYDEHIDMIFAYCRKRLPTTEIAEDITSTVFEKALLNLKKFSPEKGSFKSWIYSIATHEIANYYRSSSKMQIHEIQEYTATSSDNPEKDLLVSEDIGLVRNLLSRLNPKDQIIMSLRHLEKYSFKKIAKEMRMTENACRTRAHRSMKKLETLAKEFV